MLKRKIEHGLNEWKKRTNHMPLIVQGARQVGKTFSIQHFAEAHYENVITLNFEERREYRGIFDGDNDIDHLTAGITLVKPGSRFVPGKTLLFLDEIQSCPNARTALKFFALDGRYDVIASGSLLGVRYREVSSFPVGYTERLDMHSLDFEEFLWALGIPETTVEYIRNLCDEGGKVNDSVHESMMEYLRQHMVIGGMPNAVRTFIDTHDYSQVLRVQRAILSDYEDDIAKYAQGSDKAKAKACFLSIPKQLARDSKKFTYSLVEKGSGARKYGGSLQWLYDAGIVNFCHALRKPELPLEGNADNAKFKVYMRDTGLLTAMLEDGSQRDILVGNLGIYKGAIHENIVGDMLAKNGRALYYYERNSTLEMDFFIRYHGKATAVEVKSSANRKAKSMDSLIVNHAVEQGIKLSPGNMGMGRNGVRILPLYMALFL